MGIGQWPSIRPATPWQPPDQNMKVTFYEHGNGESSRWCLVADVSKKLDMITFSLTI